MAWFVGMNSSAEEAYFVVCKAYFRQGFLCLIADGLGSFGGAATLGFN